MNRDFWKERINQVENYLKQKEIDRISPKEKITEVTFFRISYKLQILKRMMIWVDLYGNLPKSYRWMLKHPNDHWG